MHVPVTGSCCPTAQATQPGGQAFPEGEARSCLLPSHAGDRGTGAPLPPAPTRTLLSECHQGPFPLPPVPRLWTRPLLELTSPRPPSLPHTKNGSCVLLRSSSWAFIWHLHFHPGPPLTCRTPNSSQGPPLQPPQLPQVQDRGWTPMTLHITPNPPAPPPQATPSSTG